MSEDDWRMSSLCYRLQFIITPCVLDVAIPGMLRHLCVCVCACGEGVHVCVWWGVYVVRECTCGEATNFLFHNAVYRRSGNF